MNTSFGNSARYGRFAGWGSVGIGPGPGPGPSQPIGIRRDVRDRFSGRIAYNYGEAHLSGWGAGDPASAYRDVAGSGGYRYRQYADGRIEIRPGSPAAVGKVYTSGTAYTAILKEIGPYPQAGDQAVKGVTDFLSALTGQQLNTPEGQQTFATQVGQILATYGPEAAQAAQTALQNKNQTLAALEKQLASKMASYAKAKAGSKKKIRLGYEIQSLKTQIETAKSYQTQVYNAAAADVSTQSVPTAPGTSTVPTWLPTAGLVVLIAAGAAFAWKKLR